MPESLGQVALEEQSPHIIAFPHWLALSLLNHHPMTAPQWRSAGVESPLSLPGGHGEDAHWAGLTPGLMHGSKPAVPLLILLLVRGRRQQESPPDSTVNRFLFGFSPAPCFPARALLSLQKRSLRQRDKIVAPSFGWNWCVPALYSQLQETYQAKFFACKDQPHQHRSPAGRKTPSSSSPQPARLQSPGPNLPSQAWKAQKCK